MPFLPKKTVVVHRRFCSWKKVRLSFVRRPDHLAVTDAKGKTVFKVQKDAAFPLMSSKQIVVDGSGNPVIWIQSKPHIPEWQVFAGDKSERELLFKVKRCPGRTDRFDVFLAANTTKKAVDFRIEGSYVDKTLTVYKGESSRILAQETAFGMTLARRVDKAFIVALIAISCDADKQDRLCKKRVRVAKGILRAILTAVDIISLIS